MKVYNWESWEQCEEFYTSIFLPSNPPGLPQGRSYYLSELFTFFTHWKECKRLAKDLLKQKNEGVTNHDQLRNNYALVLKSFGIPNLDDNLNSFLVQYHYSIYV